MRNDIELCVLSFAKASPGLQGTGLLGWVRIRYGGLILDSIAVRLSANGRVLVSFPERKNSRGERHPIIRPIDDAARRDLEFQILGGIGPSGCEVQQ